MEIREQTIQKAWKRVLWKVLHTGQPIFIKEYGQTKELSEPLMVTITDPTRDRICEGSGWGKTALEIYYEKCTNPDPMGFQYSYGSRLLDYDGINQIQENMNTLDKDVNSRRAIAITWMPAVDLPQVHVPCMILQQRMIREGKLNLVVLFRSQDLFGGWPSNLYMLSRWLECDCDHMSLSVGTLTCITINGHIYKNDILKAGNVIGENIQELM